MAVIYVRRTRQSKKNSSRCSIVGINGKIDPPSEYDEVDGDLLTGVPKHGGSLQRF